jgi:hypothetical protein
MTHIIEFKDEFKIVKGLITVQVKASDKVLDWQRSFKGKKPDIKSISKIDNGYMVVYEV